MRIETKAKCQEAVLDTILAANEIWNLNADLPTIDFFNKGKAAGIAYRYQHKVAFNEVLMRENPDNFMKTVVHEVAHLVTPRLYPYAKQAHGPEFKYIMNKMLKFLNIEETASRCHSYDVSSVTNRKQFIYTCASGCQHTVSQIIHKRIQGGQTRVCTKTKAHIKAFNFVRAC